MFPKAKVVSCAFLTNPEDRLKTGVNVNMWMRLRTKSRFMWIFFCRQAQSGQHQASSTNLSARYPAQCGEFSLFTRWLLFTVSSCLPPSLLGSWKTGHTCSTNLSLSLFFIPTLLTEHPHTLLQTCTHRVAQWHYWKSKNVPLMLNSYVWHVRSERQEATQKTGERLLFCVDCWLLF